MTEQVDRAKLAIKIQALLAQAEGEAAAGNEAARDTFLEKAAALQLKHAIEDAMLAVGTQNKDEIATADFCIESNTPLIKAKRQLINGLASWNRGKAVMMGDYKPKRSGGIRWDKRAKIRVYAHQSDLDFITMLYNSLILQMQTMMAADERIMIPGFGRHASAKRRDVSSWRVSYAYGWVDRVIGRIAEAARRNEAAAESGTPGTALVLEDRKAIVVKHVEDKFGQLRTTRYRIDDKSHDGRAAGRAAAERADLGDKKVSGSSTRLPEA
jgi:hypothetical protein